MKKTLLVLSAVCIAAGCSSSDKSSADTASPVPAAAPAVAYPQQAKTKASDCPHDGKWALCSIERRLKQSGFVVTPMKDDTARRAGFTVKPAVYNLGKARLEVFVYRDSSAAARDIAKLDTLTAGPKGSVSQWGEVPPTLIRSANIAAVFLSQNPRQVERAILALTAGPPQPGSPR